MAAYHSKTLRSEPLQQEARMARRFALGLLALVVLGTTFAVQQARATPGSRFFPQTGYIVRDPFLATWQRGGVELFGYPISPELQEHNRSDGKLYTVQYFERARLELHPGEQPEVQLGLLGRELYRASAPPPDPRTMLSAEADRIVELLNAERVAAGLAPLRVAVELNLAAEEHSRDMADSGLISHTGSDGSSIMQRISDAGYAWARCGENIAVGQRSPEEAMAFWMSSPPHRANILDPQMQEVGVGYMRQDAGFGHYWTINLGAR
jgi:uncharacterized protein YkwD